MADLSLPDPYTDREVFNDVYIGDSPVMFRTIKSQTIRPTSTSKIQINQHPNNVLTSKYRK
ncbi:hypothetical protein DPMN_143271 [Dreissena polymorpha]|uniref:Uncharacterized protein n=1 Tax=Dreissena polymorpha TaxID=45954 RepID=A0A9D4JJJ0_DREPO|nr:hypothetical protein DPMN_143271 [Dreissena polymorpha]